MSEETAKALLVWSFVVSICFDIAAGIGIWLGKPWWVPVCLILLGAGCHPGAQPTLREYARGEES